MIPKSVLALVAVAVVALVAVPMLFATSVPDINSSPASIGYADITVDIRYTVQAPCTVQNDVATGCQIGAVLARPFMHAEEHLALPQRPASFFRLPTATFSATCNSRVVITVTGPGVNRVVTQESNLAFTPDAQVHHVFGHLYLTSTGEHTVGIEAFVSGCYANQASQLGEARVLTTPRTFIFDGEDDQ